MKINYFLNIFKKILTPIHVEGIKFIAIFGIITFFLILINSTLGLIGIVLTLWCAFFFRDPIRYTPKGEDLIISPADGILSDIDHNVNLPLELNLDQSDNQWIRLGIFLNVFDVHVNRIPIDGKILDIRYRPGKFLGANLDEASKENERNSSILETKNGQKIIFVQIAGMIARRIVSNINPGQKVLSGEKFGIIRFGSRVDLYLPFNSDIKVLKGQKMIGGETVLAKLKPVDLEEKAITDKISEKNI